MGVGRNMRGSTAIKAGKSEITRFKAALLVEAYKLSQTKQNALKSNIIAK